jgi:hypothetical protein
MRYANGITRRRRRAVRALAISDPSDEDVGEKAFRGSYF